VLNGFEGEAERLTRATRSAKSYGGHDASTSVARR